MTKSKSQLKEMIMRETRKEVKAFIDIEDQIRTVLEYEDKVLEICRSLGKRLLSGGLELEKKGKNSKKN